MGTIKYYFRTFFVDIPKLAGQLAGGSFLEQIHLCLQLWWFVLSRKTILKGKPKHFRFTFEGKAFEVELRSGIDVAVLGEVFVLKEYVWDKIKNPKAILDLGAHWGDTAIYYALKYPDARIISVEPSPHIFKRLKTTTKQFSHITPVQGALGSETGEMEFFVSENTLGNSLTRRSSSDSVIKVRTFTINDLCSHAGIETFDLIKFDIEGGEQHIFSDPGIKKRANAFIGEIHLDLMDVSLEDIRKYFINDFEVEIQQIHNQRYIIKAFKKDRNTFA